MAFRPLHDSISIFISFFTLLRRIFSGVTASGPDDDVVFISTRRKEDPIHHRILPVAKTYYYKGLEQDDAKDGQLDSTTSRDDRSEDSHECILQMNSGLRSSSTTAMPSRRTSCFILDSGATSHVVGDVSLFSPSSFRSRTATPAGRVAAASYKAHDERVLTVAGTGTISCDNFHLPNVLCVPDLCTGLHLVSVLQLAECDYLVMFGGGQCSVVDRSSGKIVGKGFLHADDGLYHLEFLHIPHDK